MNIINTRVCTKCREVKTIDKFGRNKNNEDGLNLWCKECNNKKSKEYYENNKNKILKLQKQYYLDNLEYITEYKKQYQKTNKEVIAVKAKQYQQDNKETIDAYKKQYRENNKEFIAKGSKKYRKNNKSTIVKYEKDHKITIAERQRKYIKDNKEYIVKRSKQYRENNKELIVNLRKVWFKKNKEKAVVYVQKRKAKKLLLPSTFTKEEWDEVKLYFNNSCAYCGEELPLEQEHFIPVSDGGGYVKGNMIPACKKCNCSKHNYDFLNWYPKYEYYSEEREYLILNYLSIFDENKIIANIV